MENRVPLREEQITTRLAHIHTRLSWIADREAQAARFNGIGARGEFSEEHARLTAETDDLLDQLKALGGTLPFDRA